VTDRHPQATHLSVTPLVQHDPKPSVPVGSSLRCHAIESCPAVLELHTLLQSRERRGIRLMPHANQIFALNFG
jgi:hypothetical protein